MPEFIEDAESFAGEPDGFGRLWTPYRMAYIKGENKPTDSTVSNCPFCSCVSRSDADGLIVHRGENAYVVMNLYPYSPGHVLICPYRHVSDYVDLTDAERVEISGLTSKSIEMIRRVARPAGFNLGMNLGSVAGAGIAAHLHQHVVPRWAGDMNFLPIIGQTRALPQLLEEARAALVEAWAE